MIRVTCTFVNQVVHDYPDANAAEVLNGILEVFGPTTGKSGQHILAAFPIGGVLKWEVFPEAVKVSPALKK